jgi:protein ImuA
MNKMEKLADLRHSLAHYGLPPDRPLMPLGVAGADQALGGGLMPGALHEVLAGDWAAGGFAACLAIRAAKNKPIFWVRPDYESLEYGALHAQGLAELGGDASRLILIRTANAAEALAAVGDILACPHVGALLLEISGHPKALDLVAGRRLNFIAAESGVTAILLREGAEEEASAALSRWRIHAAASGGDEWGWPSYRAHLIRNRLGPTGAWAMTWNPDHGLFREPAREYFAPHPGYMVAPAFHRPAEASRQRRAEQSEKRRFAF